MPDDLWGRVSLDAWRSTPVTFGRVAGEDDVLAGRAVFYIDAEGSGPRPGTLALPALAIARSEDGRDQVVVVIQYEIQEGDHVLGVRFLAGGSGVCMLEDVRFCDEAEARAAEAASIDA